jgi:hypothetical protein
MTRPLRTLGAAGLLLAASACAVAVSGTAHADTQMCDKFASTTIQNRYVVMNNRWGADTPQCVNVTNGGFAVTANHSKPTNGAPASYPAIYYGCHYTNCSPATTLPMQVSQIHNATSSISFSYPGSGTYDAAYDIWLDPTPKKDAVNQQELMIWFNRQGTIQPVGAKTGNATIGGRTWEVWTGNNGMNDVVSYVAPSPITTWNFSVLDFVNDTKTRSKVTNSWYLTSIQAGFEPWVGGTGLAITSFTATVNGSGGGGGSTPPPPAPSPTANAVPSPAVNGTTPPAPTPSSPTDSATPSPTGSAMTVTVAGPGGPGPLLAAGQSAALPVTGTAAQTLLAVAVAMIGLGAALFMISRPRVAISRPRARHRRTTH